MTALMLATEMDEVCLVKLLIQHGADATKPVGEYASAIHHAAALHNVKCLDALFSGKKSWNKASKEAFDLVYQIRLMSVEVLMVLLLSGITVDQSVHRAVLQRALLEEDIEDELVSRYCTQCITHPGLMLVRRQERLMPALHAAVLAHLPATINSLVKAGAGINSVDQGGSGVTALHLAVKSEDVDVVQAVMALGPDTSIGDEDGATALTYAVWIGNAELLRLLLLTGNLWDPPDKLGYTGFCTSCSLGQVDIMKILLEEGANANTVCPTELQETPLHLLVKSSNASRAAVQLLLECGANVGGVDVNGRTALHHAMFHCKQEVIIALLEAQGSDVNVTDNDGNTALHTMVLNKYKHEDNGLDFIARQWVVRQLIDHGIDILKWNQAGKSAQALSLENNDMDLCRYMMPLIHPDTPLQQDGYGAIHILAEVDNMELMTHMHQTGYFTSLDYREPSGMSAVMIATRRNHIDMAQYLLSHAASVLLISDSGSILHCIVESRQEDLLQQILMQRSIQDVFDVRNQDGHTATQYAFHQGNVDCLKWLLAAGCPAPDGLTYTDYLDSLEERNLGKACCIIAIRGTRFLDDGKSISCVLLLLSIKCIYIYIYIYVFF